MSKNHLLTRKLVAYAITCVIALSSSLSLFSQAPELTFNPVISGLSSPVDFARPGDGSSRLFIAEKTGRIRIISNGVLLANAFLDLSGILPVNSGQTEQGLLSLAFHPQYTSNGYFFVYYNNSAGSIEIARYQRSSDPLVALPNSGQVLITIAHPGQSNHNGGKLNFGSDGNLYFATGDGGGGGDIPNNAQNGNSLLGKMLRINVDNFATSAPFYTIPAGNPFISDPNVLDEIWIIGLRNPFRWSFDRLTQDMWIADVGQGDWEEVNFRTAGNTGGLNYGWRCYEGTHEYNTAGCAAANNYVQPIFEYDHNPTTGGSSITGGSVYRGANFSSLYGYYITADYVSGNVWLIKPDGSGGWAVTRQAGLPGNIVAFGEDATGELYAVSLNGAIYQVQVLNSLPVKLVSFTAASQNGMHLIKWQVTSEKDVKQFDVQFSNDGANFQTIGTIIAGHSDLTRNYEYNYRIPMGVKIFYRLKIINNDGKEEFSNIINPLGNDETIVSVMPTLVTNGRITIKFSKPFNEIQVADLKGHILKSRKLEQSIGTIDMDISNLPKGMYMIRLIGNTSSLNKKIIVQ